MHTPTPEKNCPFPFGYPGPCILYGSLDTAESTSQTASWSVQLIWQSSRLTYRHTHRAWHIGNNRLHLCMRFGPTATFFSVISERATSWGGGFFMGKNFMWHQPVGNVAGSGCSCDFCAFYFVWFLSFSKNYFCVQEKKSILSDCGFWFSWLSQWLIVLGWRWLNRFVFNVYLLLLLLLSSAFTSRISSAVQWQHHQLSAIATAHPPAWSVGSC